MKFFDTLILLFFSFSTFAQVTVPVDSLAEGDTEDEDTATQDTVVATDTALPWPQNVQESISELLKGNMFETTQVGVMVWDLTADSCIFRYNERQRMRPASTMKNITAITALDKLGSDYKYSTHLYVRGECDSIGKSFSGDIYVKGGMDPMFSSADMQIFVDSLKALGVDTIRGTFYADRSFKDKDKWGEGWCWDDDNPVLSPLLYNRKDELIDHLMARLRKAGIVVWASDSEGRVPHDARLMATRSHSIGEVMQRMLKQSDNLYAESMLYQIAHHESGAWAAAKSARNVVRRLLTRIGLKGSDYAIADGSGLSLYNYVSAEALTLMLRYAYQHENIYTTFYRSLPIAGIDGTLEKRMRGTKAARNVHAKTGTVTGIRSLSGYLTASNGHEIAFTIINQGVKGSAFPRSFQDKVCRILAQ